MTTEDIAHLLEVDKDLWKKEFAQMRDYYDNDIKANGGNIPDALYAQLDKLEANLNK